MFLYLFGGKQGAGEEGGCFVAVEVEEHDAIHQSFHFPSSCLIPARPLNLSLSLSAYFCFSSSFYLYYQPPSTANHSPEQCQQCTI